MLASGLSVVDQNMFTQWLSDPQAHSACWTAKSASGLSAPHCPVLAPPQTGSAHSNMYDLPLVSPASSSSATPPAYSSDCSPLDTAHSPGSDGYFIPSAAVPNFRPSGCASSASGRENVPADFDLPTKLGRPKATRAKSRRLPHSTIERRYRDNLNRQIEIIRDKVPAFSAALGCPADIEEVNPTAKWPSKGVVIAAASRHIEKVEREREQAYTSNLELRKQIDALQKFVRCEDCWTLMSMQANSAVVGA